MQSIDFATNRQQIKNVYSGIVSGDPVRWAVFSPDSNGAYYTKETGDTDIEDFVENFSPSHVEFGFMRVKPPMSDVEKFLLIGWCPDSSPPKVKISFMTNFATVGKILHGAHVSVIGYDEDDLEPSALLKKMSDSAGARYSVQRTGGSASFASSGASSGAQKPKPKPVVKPIVPKQASKPKPQRPVDDGWGDAAAVEERDLTKTPLESVKPAWKPVGRVSIDAIRSGVEPARRTAPPMPKKEFSSVKPVEVKPVQPKPVQPKPVVVKPVQVKPVTVSPAKQEEREDLDADEQAFRDKRKIFDQQPVAQTAPTPTRRPVNSSSFQPKQAFGTARQAKVPLPVYNEFKKSEPKPKSALENGKTPAQIWAEKHGKYDSSAVPEIVNKEITSSKTESSEEDVSKKFEQVTLTESSPAPVPVALPKREVPPAVIPKEEETDMPILPSRHGAPVPLPPGSKQMGEAEEEEAESVAEEEPAPEVEEEPEEETAKEEGPTESKLVAIAQFDYTAEDEDEISFVEGEVITIVDNSNEDWWTGINAKGEQGQFPYNYVAVEGDFESDVPAAETEEAEDAIPEHTDTTAVALYDNESVDASDELVFKEGDLITDIYSIPGDEEWCYGTLNGKRGLVPLNFIEIN